ncbi:hypothetical protein NEMIN01_1486 [Nematocida minor]|uniref:uncharacterized protein n=1 Tax=Nematocida minor TaxID=1912983 RepID=UPI00221FE689|nr:uncharacterized protein NEMIN01_1486 [Nematocida minor]KAI5191327.1 hypothetical protein NEMIN01_1486 [Nematocida minor]
MKILSIDLGSYKTVVASSDTSAGEIILTKTGSRSTKMAIDYRNKIREFGNVNVTCKEREKVAEDIRKEIEELAEQMKNRGAERVKIMPTSHVYGLLNNLINNYTQAKGISSNELEIEIVVPSTYTQLHKNILIKILNLINPKVQVECITDSMALSSYYLSRRTPSSYRMVAFVDIGDAKTTATLAVIKDTNINVINRVTVEAGGRNITNHLLEKIYSGLDKSIPDLFSKKEFRVRNIKKIEWIKGAIFGLPSVSTQVDASYDKSVGVCITKADIEEVLDEFSELKKSLSLIHKEMNDESVLERYNLNSEEDIEQELQITGGSSRMFIFEDLVHSIFQLKPEVHLNADESIALGGVYRRLMESPFHRFRYDPLIKDVLDHPYVILISEENAETRAIRVFEKDTIFVKEMKSKILGKKYDTSIVLEQNPRKTVKLSKITERSTITVWSGDCPVYMLKLKPTETPAAEEGAPNQKQNTPEQTPSDGKKTVKLVMSLNGTGNVEITSEDVEMVDALDMLNLATLKRTEDAYLNREKTVLEIEGKINSIQASMFESIELLGGELSTLPSAEAVMADLWERSQTVESLAASAKSMQEVLAFEESVEKKLSLEKEWNTLATEVASKVSEAHSLELSPPKYPGVLSLYSISLHMENEAQKELERRERIRKYEEEQRQLAEQRKLEEQRREEEQKRAEEEQQNQDNQEGIKETSE